MQILPIPDNRNSQRRRGGFTLVEILVLMVVIAVVSTVFAYDVYRDMDRVTLRGEAMTIQRMCRFGQLVSGQRYVDCRVCVDLMNRTYWLEMMEKPKVVGQEENEETIEPVFFEQVDDFTQPRSLGEGVEIEQFVVDGKDCLGEPICVIHFNPDGTADGTKLVLTNQTEVITIIVYPCTSRCEFYRGRVSESPGDQIVISGAQGETTVFR